MQTQNFAPPADAPRTILLGRNRLNALAENRQPVVKSFDNTALRASHSVRKAGMGPLALAAGRGDRSQSRDR